MNVYIIKLKFPIKCIIDWWDLLDITKPCMTKVAINSLNERVTSKGDQHPYVIQI